MPEKDFLADKSDESLLNELRRVANLFGKRSVTQAEFKKHGNVSCSMMESRFGKWNNALLKAGLEITRRNNIPIEEIYEDIDQVWNKLERRPSYDEFNKFGRFSSSLLENRFGSYLKALDAYITWKEQKSNDYSKVVHDSEIPENIIHDNTESKSNSKRIKYGSLVNFRGLQHAPLNELGVVFLFGMVSKELEFSVEAISVDFPDCEAKRYDPKSKTCEKISIEFEFNSSNFKKHDHDPNQCDLIVCWEHDWKDCPIEVLELSKIIEDLKE